MKVPESKRRQIAKKGGALPAKRAGGGALARLEQLRKQRGIKSDRPAKAGRRGSSE